MSENLAFAAVMALLQARLAMAQQRGRLLARQRAHWQSQMGAYTPPGAATPASPPLPPLARPPAYHGPPARPHEFFHYTTGQALPSILAQGCLLPHREHPDQAHGITWFSRNHIYEYGALKPSLTTGQKLSFVGMLQTFGLLGRIAVDEAVLPYDMAALMRLDQAVWYAYTQATGDTTLARLHTWGWRASLEPIPHTHWLRVEEWSPAQAQWLPYNSEGRTDRTQGEQS